MSVHSSAGSIHGDFPSGTHKKGYQNDTLNPYFLHPNENPSLVLVTPPLSGSNYHSWSRSMTMALKSKYKLHFVTGSLPRPLDDDLDSLAWDRCNTMVMSWLNNSVDPEISQSILWMDTASEIWQDLKDRFYQGDVFRISDIQEEIYTLKQGDSSISAYYTKMKKLWQELDNFRPIPESICVFECAVILKMKEYRDSDQVIRFLKGLNDQYSAVRSRIMLMDPLPHIGKVYSLLVQQERQVLIPLDESKLLAAAGNSYTAGKGSYGRGKTSKNNGYGSKPGSGRGKGSGSNKMCSYCGQTNHIVDSCWKKHGYPPHLQHLANGNGNGTVNNCTNERNGDDDDTQSADYDDGNAESDSGKLFFTPAQHKALLALLQGSSTLPSHSINHVTHVASTSGILCTASIPSDSNRFILDTGATHHVCYSLQFFQCLKKINPIHLKLPNGSLVTTCFSGTIVFDQHFFLTDVLYFPSFSFNLIFVPQLTQNLQCTLIFDNNDCLVQEKCSKMMIGVAKMLNGLFILQSPSVTLGNLPSNCCINSILSINHSHPSLGTNNDNNCTLWHRRFGHASHAKLSEINKIFPFVHFTKSSDPCDICFFAKQKRLPFTLSNHVSKQNFDLIHMDIWGPISVPSMLGFKYFLTIVDDKSRFTWIYLLKLKSEASTYIKHFCSMVKTQFETNIKCIRSDNGTEFLLKKFYLENGIIHQTSCVSTPQQNGIVERKHQHILGIARALLFQANLPHIFWAHAVGHAIHIINRLHTPFLNQKTPFQILFNELPDVSNLRVFGSLVFATTLSNHRKKLDPRSRKCIALGFRSGVKGHILFDLKNKEIFVSRDVIFFEHIFPYKNSSVKASEAIPNSCPSNTLDSYDYLFNKSPTTSNFSQPKSTSPTPNSSHTQHHQHVSNSQPVQNSINQPVNTDHTPNSSSHTNDSDQPTSDSTNHPPNPQSNPEPPLRRSQRITKPPTYLQDYHMTLLNASVHQAPLTASTSLSQCKFPLSSFISYDNLSHAHTHYALNLSSINEPNSYEEAMCNENWRNAIDAELSALMKNKTWDLVTLPAHKKAIGCKWVFKLKLHADGSVERYKARLVAKGFTQTEGIDYMDTFSPVVKMTTVRVFMALAASQDWPLFQLDVNTAFLHGDLNEEVYMKPPPGLPLQQENLVCKLQRSLYGLKQASRQWNAKLTETLISSGFIQSKADYSLFTKKTSRGFTAILVYVDDLVLGGTDIEEINQLKSMLDQKFSIKDLGQLKYFLGFDVARTKAGIALCQRKYTLDLLADAGLLAAKPCSTPMQPQLQLHKSSGTPLTDPTTYRRLIGRLLYLTHSRPEISYAVSKLSQFLDAPTDTHMLAGLHVLRFLKNHPGQGLFFSASSPLTLKGYSDSDWGACPDTRRSTTGFCFFIGTSLVSWKSKKQNVVSRSSSEAEYRALAQATCEGQWLLYLLRDFLVSHDNPIVLYCDNKSALHIVANPVFHERTKHIEIDCHVVRDKIQSNILHLLPVTSKEQVADIFTKSLQPGPFHTLQSKLGMFDMYSSLRGHVNCEETKE
jgi:hypothetical protein